MPIARLGDCTHIGACVEIGMTPARSELLRIGRHEVDVARRTSRAIDGGGSGTRLTVKAVQVLLVLVEAEGKVMSRDALFARVWPDTMPTDDVLTQAVTQLRKAFGDDRDAPRYIETIAKGGYRLVAAAEWQAMGGDAGGGVAAHAASDGVGVEGMRLRGMHVLWQGRRAVALALGAVVLVLAAWAWVRTGPFPGDTQRPTLPEAGMEPLQVVYKAITSMPGEERWPSLSPDGSMVAFSQSSSGRNDTAILLQAAEHMPARRLTTPPPEANDLMPVWARDGRRIAFIRSRADDCRIMVVSVGGGIEHDAGACLQRTFSLFDWTPDGRGLVMGGLQQHGETKAPLRILDLSTGQWTVVSYEVPDDTIDVFPRYSPDGKWLAFRRNGSFSDLWMMPAEGGKPQRLTTLRDDIRGWDWLPDGSGLVFSRMAPSATLFVHRLNDGSVRPFRALGGAYAVFPDIARDDWSMVFEINESRGDIVRFRLDGDGSGMDGRETLFASSATDMLPAVSPDGSLLAFYSDRALSLQLWIGEVADQQKLHAVEGLVPVPRHRPVWSADGRRLLVIGSTDEGDRLFEVEVGSGAVRRLPVPDAMPIHAAYTGDPSRLLVGVDGGDGRVRLVAYQLPGWQVMASLDDAAIARYDERNDVVYFSRSSRRGLWRADASLRTVEQVTDAFPSPGLYRHWGVVAGEVHYAGPAQQCQTLWRRIDDEGQGNCIGKDAVVLAGSPSVDANGRWLYVAIRPEQNINVGWVSLEKLKASRSSDAEDATY